MIVMTITDPLSTTNNMEMIYSKGDLFSVHTSQYEQGRIFLKLTVSRLWLKRISIKNIIKSLHFKKYSLRK